MTKAKIIRKQPGRFLAVLSILMIAIGGLIWRFAELHVFSNAFLRDQGEARTLRNVTLPTYRGMIRDRYGEPLAVSTPVDSIWLNPKEVDMSDPNWTKAQRWLDISLAPLKEKVAAASDKEFLYVKRHVDPEVAQKVDGLNLAGVELAREYRRFYPAGEVAAQVIGVTDIDDQGQEGLELAFDEQLAGKSGKKRVLRDRVGREVEVLEVLEEPIPGQDVQLSIDRRLQYLAYKALKDAVHKHAATAGSVVILDIKTGEVLAMANQPSFNPNQRVRIHDGRFRNRAVTDLFEPGSVMKSLSAAHILEREITDMTRKVNTAPGTMRVGTNIVKDTRNYGELDLKGILMKSSNVGISKLAMELPHDSFSTFLTDVGFGSVTESQFPGESPGYVVVPNSHQKFTQATMSFGYGVQATVLQLAQAYAMLGNGGVRMPVTFLKRNAMPSGERIVSPRVAREVMSILHAVTGKNGSGWRAQVPGFAVAGKTGTAKKNQEGAYLDGHYVSVFAGVAPYRDPRLAMVVMIDDPQGGQYYGGLVAAPVFSNVMQSALRMLGIAPDPVDSPLYVAQQGSKTVN